MLRDLAAKIPLVVDRMGYDQRISTDVKAGLLARVNQLRLAGGKGLMLNTRRRLDTAALFERPCVLELKQLVSDDEKAFVIGLLLIRLYEYHEGRQRRGSGLAHVTLIEEAHRLLRNVSTEQGSDVSPNPQGRAVEVFANILSEIRAFGEGIIVAEQIPTKLTPDVVKNTGFKLVHRLVSPDDRDMFGRALNLSATQIRRLAALSTGEGVAWTERTAKAVLVQVPAVETAQQEAVSDDLVRACTQDPAALFPYDTCRTCPHASAGGCAHQPDNRWDQALMLAFRRALNALRHSAAAVVPTFAEFHHLMQRDSRPGFSAMCTFTAIAEHEIERRGEFRAWQFADVHALTTAVSDMARAVLSALERGETPVVPESRVRLFQETWAALDRVATLPYPGCRDCVSPCRFRYDMAHVGPPASRDFRRAYLDLETPTHSLATMARAAAKRSFFIADKPSHDGAALCFAIQEFANPALGLSTFHQLEMAKLLKQQIAPGK